MDTEEGTSFVVVADAQLLGSGGESDQEAIATLEAIGENTADTDFGIQTGDYVDGGIEL